MVRKMHVGGKLFTEERQRCCRGGRHVGVVFQLVRSVEGVPIGFPVYLICSIYFEFLALVISLSDH